MNAALSLAMHTALAGRRILSLWFPYLATDRIWRQRLGRAWLKTCSAFPPLLVSHRDGNAHRIAALDHRAEKLNLKRGKGVADARAMHPSVEIVEADPVGTGGEQALDQRRVIGPGPRPGRELLQTLGIDLDQDQLAARRPRMNPEETIGEEPVRRREQAEQIERRDRDAEEADRQPPAP